MNYSKWLCQWHNLCLSNRISVSPVTEAVSAGAIGLPFHLSSLETTSKVTGCKECETSSWAQAADTRAGGSNIQRRYRSPPRVRRRRIVCFEESRLFLSESFRPIYLLGFAYHSVLTWIRDLGHPGVGTGAGAAQRTLHSSMKNMCTGLGLHRIMLGFLKRASYIWLILLSC